MDLEVDKTYRLNSRFATMRKLPRDVLVHFVRTRGYILDYHFKYKLRMENMDIIVLKKIPVRILRKREGYSFLTDILKKIIPFRWDKPEGMLFTYQEQRCRLWRTPRIF